MKFAVVFTACLALLAMQVVASEEKPKFDLTKLKVQQFFLEILFRLDDPLAFEEWIKLGNELVIDEKYYSEYDSDMLMFVNLYKANRLQPKTAFFNPMQPCHVKELKGLFKFFFYAMDMEVMLRNMVWARMNVSPGLFVHALTLTVTHHKNLQNIVLPEIDEIFPQMFVDGKHIAVVEKLDWDMWNRMIMLEKELKITAAKKLPYTAFGNQFFSAGFKLWQWWKLMGLSDGWQFEQKSMLRENYEEIRKDPKFQSIYKQMKMFWLPIDYTRDIETPTYDAYLSYFTEDRSWNKFWYYLNMEYPLISDMKEFKPKRHDEWWFYNLKLMMARYNFERLSMTMETAEPVTLGQEFDTAYNPLLVALNGEQFAKRDDSFKLDMEQGPALFKYIKQLEDSIGKYLLLGKITVNETHQLDLKVSKSINDFMGGLVRQTDYMQLITTYLSGADYDTCRMEPNVLVNYQTQLRDPITYSIFSTLYGFSGLTTLYKKPVNAEDHAFPQITLLSLEVSQLETYFDLADLDMSTLLNDKMVFHDGKYVWDKVALGRQLRLNHKPFEFKLEVNSLKDQKVTVRVFLLSLCDAHGETAYSAYYKLDQFDVDVTTGNNTIERSSNDFTWTKKDSFTYSEIYAHLSLAMEGKMEFDPEMYPKRSLFPHRLILPRGKPEGLPVVVFFYIHPYNENLPYDLPFDKISMSGIADLPNVEFVRTMIYHVDKTSNYYPKTYQNFGTFDEDFF